MEKEKEKYAELMDESIEIGTRVMLRVRADLYREYREGKVTGWDVDHAIKEYEAALSEEDSDDENSAPGPSSLAKHSSPAAQP